ncbi:MAG: RICIN domain-containing protein, partial [Burkholderiaceae bacterium]
MPLSSSLPLSPPALPFGHYAAAAALAFLLAGCSGGTDEQPSPVQTSAPSLALNEGTAKQLGKSTANATANATAALDGIYKITSQCGNKVLGVADASTADRARIRIFDWTNSAHQQWKIEAQPDGTYRLVAQHSGKVADASSAVTENGTPVFHQHPWHGRANQRFAIDLLDDGSYRFIVQHNQKALDVAGASTAQGATVWQWDWNATCAQRWKLERLDAVDPFTPVATAVHAGNDQQAVVSTAVPTAPAIKVSDREGRGVAN